MANTKLILLGSKRTNENDELYVMSNEFNEIEIYAREESQEYPTMIHLDEKTAIRLVKELRRQIGIIKATQDGKD